MDELLETQIGKATDPSRTSDRQDCVTAVCDKVNRDLDGPQVCLRYIIEKVKCRHADVALLALNVIEACVKNCGKRFHQEVGKYRFLNELIKLLSSKYDGDMTPEPVKKKIIELLYGWTKGLPSETKIAEAYKMLKHQGVVTKDPDDPYGETKTVSQPRADTIFGEDEDKSKLLARLLKSKHPEDLQAANKLIKSMVRQDEVKMERLAKRIQELETSCNNITLLTEMMNNYSPSSPPQDRELMKELYDACDKMRPQLFKLASAATEEGDEGLADILKVNDDLSRVMEEYRKRFSGLDTNTAERPTSSSTLSEPAPDTNSSLIDLGISQPKVESTQNAASSVLEKELKALGIDETTVPQEIPKQEAAKPVPGGSHLWLNQGMMPGQGMPQVFPNPITGPSSIRPMATTGPYPARGGLPSFQSPVMGFTSGVNPPPPQSGPFHSPHGLAMTGVPPMLRPGPVTMGTMNNSMTTSGMMVRGNVSASGEKKSHTSSLDLLGQELLLSQKQEKEKPQVSQTSKAEAQPKQVDEGCLLSLGAGDAPERSSLPPDVVVPPVTAGQAPRLAEVLPLDDVFVPLDSILPGSQAPVTVLDKNGVRTVFHGAKAMKVKLQPPSATSLPAYNPVLPPSAITQVMVIANPNQEKIRLKYRISYEVNGASVVETGDAEHLPIE